MNGSAGPKITVLYKISNVKGEEGCSYNAFELPGTPGGISLSTVKNSCHALRHLNSAGANGYHWRVRVDDKSSNAKSAAPKYSWWDIQDDAARLPVKEVGFSELQNMLSPPSTRKSLVETSSSSSKGGMVRSLGKAMNKVAATVEGTTTSSTFDGPGAPRVPILIFKLLDMVKLHDEHSSTPARTGMPARSRPVRQPDPRPSTTATRQQQSTSAAPQRRRQPPPATAAATSAKEGSLMDFGPGPTTHSHSAPPSFGSAAATAPPSNETRAQKLKREYEKKKQTENRVWDEVDQRWVTVEAKNGATVNRGSTSAPPGVVPSSSSSQNNASKPKVKGISLDQANTIGKSANVAAAVQSRVNEMKSSQEKAVAQIREREEAKKKSEAEEDIVRQKLEPKIKAWSEEHGKKKQLRALLASLHTILWPEAKWKQVNLGDLLDDKKVKLAFHKASRVVHPDKTMKLPAEQRFLAKRIFDALSQAKSEFDK